MKTTLPILAALSATAGFVAADELIANATTGSSAGNNSSVGRIDGWYCFSPAGTAKPWYYNSRSDGPYACSKKNSYREWSMLKAYRSGGIEGVHWKYTNDEYDGECLDSWKFYASDGHTVIATISGRTTTQNDSRRWCALLVYLPGGVEGKQWAMCQCRIITKDHPLGL
jgi:hypothetical protein